MILSIDAQRYVKPVKVGGWNKGETWFGYFVYSFADIKRTFKQGYSLRDCLNDIFSYGCDGPGQAYTRKYSVRLHKGFVIVGQHGGMDI